MNRRNTLDLAGLDEEAAIPNEWSSVKDQDMYDVFLDLFNEQDIDTNVHVNAVAWIKETCERYGIDYRIDEYEGHYILKVSWED